MNIWPSTAGWPSIRPGRMADPHPERVRALVLLGTVVVFFGLVVGTVDSAHARTVTPWSRIPRAERHLLRPWAGRWAHLPRWRRHLLLRRAKRWMHLTPAERRRALYNLRRWRRLPPGERARIRNAFRRFRALPRWRQRQLMRQWKRRARGMGPPHFIRRHVGPRGGHIPHAWARARRFPRGGFHPRWLAGSLRAI